MNLRKLIALAAAFGACVCFAEAGYIGAKAELAQMLLARSFAQQSAAQLAPKPWPWADFRPVARLQIKRLGLDVVALSDASPRHLAFGPTLSRVSTPSGEMKLLNAHRDTHFAALANVAEGDQITLRQSGELRRYRVKTILITATPNLALNGVADGAIVLSTCYPFNAVNPHGPQRFVVYAEAQSAR